jgi:hypothetical protein
MQELARENDRLMNELRILKSSTAPSMISNFASSPPTNPSDLLRLQVTILECFPVLIFKKG